MNMKIRKFMGGISVLLAIVICVWCVGIKIQGVTLSDSLSALMLMAGVKTETEEAVSSLPIEQEEESSISDSDKPEFTRLFNEPENMQEGNPVINENDGIVPFHSGELPSVTTEPDPDRATLPIEVIQATGGAQLDNFYIKDNTGSGTNLSEELLASPSVDIKANGEIEVLLYHTHTSEAYLDTANDFYYTDMQTRSLNQDMGVVAVGEEIKKELEKAGIGVIHDTTVCDTMFNGSYSRSWEVLQSNLEEHPTIQVTIDIHRDSMTTEEGVKYRVASEIDGRNAAQIMLIAGCDANGEWGDFPNWMDNLHLAMRVQQKACELYPGLMRPLNFSNSKYNMNATKGSMLIEVGTEVNTIGEAKYSGKLMGKVLSELFTEPW